MRAFANHGQIALGVALPDALELAEEVEVLAAQYVTALTVAQPVVLTDGEMKRAIKKFKTYGKSANPSKKKPKAAD